MSNADFPAAGFASNGQGPIAGHSDVASGQNFVANSTTGQISLASGQHRLASPQSEADAIALGRALQEARDQHRGDFAAWVEEHCDFSYRSARRFMSYARAVDADAGLYAPASMPASLTGVEPLSRDDLRALSSHLGGEAWERLDCVIGPADEGFRDLGGEMQTLAFLSDRYPNLTLGDCLRCLDENLALLTDRTGKLRAFRDRISRADPEQLVWFTSGVQAFRQREEDYANRRRPLGNLSEEDADDLLDNRFQSAERSALLNGGRFDVLTFAKRAFAILAEARRTVRPVHCDVPWPPVISSEDELAAYQARVEHAVALNIAFGSLIVTATAIFLHESDDDTAECVLGPWPNRPDLTRLEASEYALANATMVDAFLAIEDRHDEELTAKFGPRFSADGLNVKRARAVVDHVRKNHSTI